MKNLSFTQLESKHYNIISPLLMLLGISRKGAVKRKPAGGITQNQARGLKDIDELINEQNKCMLDIARNTK